MILLELFSGTKSFTKEWLKIQGNESITVDIDKKSNPDVNVNILEWNYKECPVIDGRKIDFIWASPECRTFSFMSGGWLSPKQ